MKIIYKFLAIILLIGSEYSNAQNNNILLYGFNDLPQSKQINPGAINKHKFHFGIPAVSNINLSVRNTPFNTMDIFERGGDINARIDDIINDMDENDFLSITEKLDIIDFGFGLKNSYLSFGASQEFNFFLNYPADIIKQLRFTGDNYIGDDIDLNQFNAEFNVLLKYNVAYQRSFLKEKLNLGVRLNYIVGLGEGHVEEINTQLRRVDDFTVNILTNNTFKTAGFNADDFKVNDLISDIGKNNGFGFDLGGTYKLTDKIEFSASVLNLGSVNWKTELRDYKSKGELNFSGLDIDLTNSDGVDSAYNDFESDLERFEFEDEVSTESYKTSLNPDVFLSAKYKLSNKHSFQGILHLKKYTNRSTKDLSLQYYGRFSKRFQLMANTTINDFGFKVGSGFSANLLGVQTYLLFDDLFGVLNPGRLNDFNFHFGINYVFFKKKKEIEKKELKEEKVLDSKKESKKERKEESKKEQEKN